MHRLQGEENKFYASYKDDCWVNLAKVIISYYADSYSMQFPLYAKSQADYDALDRKKYAPMRHSILIRCKNGPLRNVINMPATYDAFERRRHQSRELFRVYWKDEWEEDLDQL